MGRHTIEAFACQRFEGITQDCSYLCAGTSFVFAVCYNALSYSAPPSLTILDACCRAGLPTPAVASLYLRTLMTDRRTVILRIAPLPPGLQTRMTMAPCTTSRPLLSRLVAWHQVILMCKPSSYIMRDRPAVQHSE